MGKPKLTPAQELLRIHLKELGIETIAEYQFYSERKWRFDLAGTTERIAFECNGHYNGRHGAGWSSDADKLNTAQMLGWRVLVFSNKDVLTGRAKAWLAEWLKPKKYEERDQLLRDMYDELKPGPTGGNDYHDAWQVFGERLASWLGKG